MADEKEITEDSNDVLELKAAEDAKVASEESAENAEKLEDTVQARLDALGEESTPEKEKSKPAVKSEEAEESTPEELAEEAEKADKATPDEDESETADEDEESKKETADKDKSTPAPKGIPDAYYRAAKHNEWTDEQISKLYEKDPELCLNTLKVLHENDNRLTKEFANLGRAKAKAKAEPAKETPQDKTSEFKPVDIAKLKETYGDDPIVDAISGMQEQIKVLSTAKPVQQSTLDVDKLSARSAEIEATQKEINGFFSAEGLKNYGEFYGTVAKGSKDWKSLTGEQHANRWSVLQMADEILTGALSLGQDLTVDEAMNRAHAVVSAPVLEKIIREDLKSKTVKRSKGISLKPSSGKPVPKTGARTSEELEGTTQQRLDKVFKKI